MDVSSPHCIVEIDGYRFDSWLGEDLISADINLTSDKSGEGVVRVYDPNFRVVDGFLAKGVRPLNASFWYGWKKDVGSALFAGILTQTEREDNITIFRFHDRSLKMKQQKKARYFKKRTDLQILKKLAEDSGLHFLLTQPDNKADEPFIESRPFDSLIQLGKSDWELALKIAAEAGLGLYVKGNTLIAFQPSQTKKEADAQLTYKKDFELLWGFNLSYKLPNHPQARASRTEVRVRGKAAKRLAATHTIEGEGRSDLMIAPGLPSASVASAAKRAKAKPTRQREYGFKGRLTILPVFQKRLELRETIRLANMGEFYGGDYLITEIDYSFSAGKLTCEMEIGRDLKSLKPKPKGK